MYTNGINKYFLAAVLVLSAMVVGCGGGGGGGSAGIESLGISSQPQSLSIYAGETAEFSVTATGNGELRYQWRNAGINIDNATSRIYRIPITTLGDNGKQFSVTVTNGSTSVASTNANLTVINPAPSISTQPVAKSVFFGETATFEVVATGKGSLSYQWRRNNEVISGANSSSYTIQSTDVTDNGAKFSVQITSDYGSVTSQEAQLNVTGFAPSIANQPTAQSVRAGDTAIFSVTATGTGTLSYQWFKNGNSIPGATASNYVTPVVSQVDANSIYSVSVSSYFGNITSQNAVLTLIDANESTACGYTGTSNSTDPLLQYQWHIKNNNLYFASDVPAAGAGLDLCMGSLWTSNISGAGINVNVVDSGLELAHEDLSARIIAGSSRNFVNGSDNPTNSSTDGDHGTSVAGLIAASKNTVGGSGVAPNAGLMGYNFLTGSQTLLDQAISFGSISNYGSTGADIFNFSAGITSSTLSKPSSSSDAIMYNITNLRNGKGAIYIKSAGNGFYGLNQDDPGYNNYCRNFGVSCQNSNQDSNNTVQNAIVTAALNADGTKSSYSTTGSSIWVSGFGGEYGYDVAFDPNVGNYKPAMLTTDQTGCSGGYVRSINPSINHLNKGDGTAANNTNCNYTAGFNGTSSAAPTVSGVVALMLQANPNLTWRDVRHILAVTSRRVNPNQSAIINSSIFNAPFTLEQGWIRNAGGYWYNNWYGFGLVNAASAVAMAQRFTAGSLGSFVSESASANLGVFNIPSGINGITKTFTITGTNPSVVEQAELNIYFGSNYTPLCTQIELLSPSGTKSIIMHALTAHTSSQTGGVRFVSNAFYGESAAGNWTLKFINACIQSQPLSSTLNQQLTIRGR